MLRFDLTHWLYWYRVNVEGRSARQMMGEAIADEDYETAKEIQKYTEAEVEEFMVNC